MDVYKKAVQNDPRLTVPTEYDKERLYELCVSVWGKELNSEHLVEEILKVNEHIDKINSLPD